jgi:hypothetical protein
VQRAKRETQAQQMLADLREKDRARLAQEEQKQKEAQLDRKMQEYHANK